MNQAKPRFSFRPIKWMHFINDVHPIFPNIAFCYVGFASFYLFVSNFLKIGSFSWTDLIIGSSTYSAVLLCLRAFDELKDQATDIINFPNRPLVKGVVARSDLYTLSSLLLLTPLVVHLAFYGFSLPTISYTVVMVFAFFTYKWFYMEKFIRPRLVWALITHNPLVYVLQFYTLSFLFQSFDEPLNKQTLLITLAFGLTGTAWEISRKLRQPSEETEYTTYTKIWGKAFSTYFVMLTLYSSAGIFIYLSAPLLAGSHKLMMTPLCLPLLALFHVTLEAKKFLNGERKGILMRQNIELYMASLTLSALVLSVLPFF
jgi:4-hydroxybenzoate polyprenyltransferase